ncbi:MAG: hypothetical protein JWN41_497, partial [Thermoleophilia bacterium]|nr:hypothetical protein [Thermoleophilia bacterium]
MHRLHTGAGKRKGTEQEKGAGMIQPTGRSNVSSLHAQRSGAQPAPTGGSTTAPKSAMPTVAGGVTGLGVGALGGFGATHFLRASSAVGIAIAGVATLGGLIAGYVLTPSATPSLDLTSAKTEAKPQPEAEAQPKRKPKSAPKQETAPAPPVPEKTEPVAEETPTADTKTETGESEATKKTDAVDAGSKSGREVHVDLGDGQGEAIVVQVPKDPGG